MSLWYTNRVTNLHGELLYVIWEQLAFIHLMKTFFRWNIVGIINLEINNLVFTQNL